MLQGGTLKEMVDSFDEEDEDEQAEERMLAENMALRSQERLSAGRGSASSHSSSSTASCSTRDPPGEEADAQFPPVKYKTAHVIQEASTQVHFVPQMAYLQGDDDENVHLCTPSHKAGSYEKKGSPVMGFSQESLWKASREGNAGVISHALGMGAYVGMHDEEDKGNTALHMVRSICPAACSLTQCCCSCAHQGSVFVVVIEYKRTMPDGLGIRFTR